MANSDKSSETEREADRLTRPDWSSGVDMERRQSLRQQVSNAMVGGLGGLDPSIVDSSGRVIS